MMSPLVYLFWCKHTPLGFWRHSPPASFSCWMRVVAPNTLLSYPYGYEKPTTLLYDDLSQAQPAQLDDVDVCNVELLMVFV